MLNIDEQQLKLLLEKKRKILGRPKYGGIGEIISGISLIITLLLSNFSHLAIIDPLYFKIIVWGISIAVLVYGIYAFVKSIIEAYSVEQLYSEISDIDPSMEHPFNIVVIRDTCETGKYLVFWSKRWKCWLFPNYHCLKEKFSKAKEETYVRECLERDLGAPEDINFRYMGNKLSTKFSVSDKVQKKYNFHYFLAIGNDFHFSKKRTFKYKGKKYCWKTLDEMYADKKIVKNNIDVLDYVRHACDIS